MNYGPCLERLVVWDRVGDKRTAEGEDAGWPTPG